MRNLAIKALSFSALTIFACTYMLTFLWLMKRGWEFLQDNEFVMCILSFSVAGTLLAVLAHIIEDKMK